MQAAVNGKAVIAGVVTILGIISYSISLGTTIDYWLQVFMSTSGDSMSPTWGPTSDGTTSYDANDGNGPRTINGWVVSTLADSEQGFTSANTQLVRLSVLDFANPGNTRFVSVNTWQDYGPGSAWDVPAGWYGMSTSGGPGNPTQQAHFHVIGGVSITGYRFFQQQRDAFAAGPGDSGLIMAPPDDTSPYAHFMNAYHAYKDTAATQGCSSNTVTITLGTTHTLTAGDVVWVHGANTNNGIATLASATHSPEVVTYSQSCSNVAPTASSGYVSFVSAGGDAGRCDAAMSGGACTWAGYTAAFQWRGTEAATMQNLHPIVYGQDGSGTGPDGSGTYTYFIGYGYYTGGYQYLHRIATANLKGPEDWVNTGGWTNPANMTHYKCAGPIPTTSCDGTNNANWDALSANATPITTTAGGPLGQNEGPVVYKGGVYYMLTNIFNSGSDAIGLGTSPAPWGPWTTAASTLIPGGNYQAMSFPTFLFPMILTQSGNQFTVPMMSDNNLTGTGHPDAGSPILTKMTIIHP